MGTLDAWYQHIDADGVIDLIQTEMSEARLGKVAARQTRRDLARARTRDHTRLLAKRADEVDGELRIVADPPLIVPVRDLRQDGIGREELQGSMRSLIGLYRRSFKVAHHPFEEYEWVDTAHKVVGVGSVGTRAWIHLFVGRDADDPLFLQSKEAQPSVLEPFIGRSAISNHGRRVVAGQRVMQAASDIFLGWLRSTELDGARRDYYVRQLHDWKGAIDLEGMVVPAATLYARLCGATLARAHARWGDRVAIASYLGKSRTFDRAIASFATAYADQNERDYAAFARAVDSGRLEAQTGV
jgi:uncharacterized protein (DUF2252 family)